MRKHSSYFACPNPPRGRKFSSRLLDYLLCGVLSVLFYFGARAIGDAVPSTQTLVSSLRSSQSELTNMVLSARLSQKEGDNLRSQNDIAKTYVKSLTKGSLLQSGVEESSLSSLYQSVSIANENNDGLCFYYVTFKPNHASSYSLLGETGLTIYRAKITEGFEDYFLTEEGYPYLNAEWAKIIDEGLRNSDYEKGTQAVSELESHYVSLLQEASREFASAYLPYSETNAQFEAGILRYMEIQSLCSLVSVLLAPLLYFSLLPLLFSNGQSLGDKALQLFYVDEEYVPGARFLLIRAGFALLESGLLFPFVLLLSSGAAGLEILASGLVFHTPIWVLLVTALFISGISYLFSFFTKNHQTLMELYGGGRQVDGRSVELERIRS